MYSRVLIIILRTRIVEFPWSPT